MTANTISKHEDIKWLKLFFLAIFCFIAFLAIIIRTGWKYLYKAIPKIAPSEKWPNWPIAAGQLAAFVILSIFINLWYQPEQTDDRANYYGNRVTRLINYLDNVKFPTINAVMDELPAEVEEIYNRTKIMDTFNITGLEDFQKWLTPNNCPGSDADRVNQMNLTMESFFNILKTHKGDIKTMRDEWKSWRGNTTKSDSVFDDEVKLFSSHKAEVITFLRENVEKSLVDWEKKIKERLTDSTGFSEYHLKYMIPGAIVFLFSIYSIYCTIFHTHVQIIRVGRSALHALFYIVTIQAILVSIDELYLNAMNDCQTTTSVENFHFFEFKSNSSSASCVARIFSPPNNKTFVGKPAYFDDLRENLTLKYEEWFDTTNSTDEKFEKAIKEFGSIMKEMNTLASTCSNVKAYQVLINETAESLNHYSELERVWKNDLKQATNKSHSDLRDLKKLIHSPQRSFNKLLVSMNFECREVFDLYRHANDESCVSINSIVISHLELVIIGCSALLAVMHLLYFRRSDHTQYWNDPRVRWAHKYVTNTIEDDQLSEWKSTNCNNLQDATYKHFEANKLQNRYNDVKCIDESRVILKNHTTDYIHASWVPIPGTRRRYIATQAPLPNTFADFWHMILQEKVEIVLQLCGYIENDIKICDVYFPARPGAKQVYGHVEVTCIEEKIAPESTRLWQTLWRSLRIVDRSAPSSPPHIIHHVFFQNWFDELVPRDNSRIPNLYRWINSLNDNERDSPICVLCDTGVGRTGIYISFDYANSLIEQDRFISMAEVNNQVAQFRWGVIDAYLDFLFIFMSLVTYYIQEGLLYFEDWSVPFKKYEDFLMNRIARMDRNRTKKEVEIQYWKSEKDPERD